MGKVIWSLCWPSLFPQLYLFSKPKVVFLTVSLGPPSQAMWALGDKIASSIVAQTAGIPTLPWSGAGRSYILFFCFWESVESSTFLTFQINFTLLLVLDVDVFWFLKIRLDSRMDWEQSKEEDHQCSSWAVWLWLYPGCRRRPQSKLRIQTRYHIALWICTETANTCMFSGNLLSRVQAAEKIGYPVMVKASEGGGGKGIRKVNCADDFPNLFRQVNKCKCLNSLTVIFRVF